MRRPSFLKTISLYGNPMGIFFSNWDEAIISGDHECHGRNVLIFGQINTMTESDGSTFHDMTKVVGR